MWHSDGTAFLHTHTLLMWVMEWIWWSKEPGWRVVDMSWSCLPQYRTWVRKILYWICPCPRNAIPILRRANQQKLHCRSNAIFSFFILNLHFAHYKRPIGFAVCRQCEFYSGAKIMWQIKVWLFFLLVIGTKVIEFFCKLYILAWTSQALCSAYVYFIRNSGFVTCLKKKRNKNRKYHRFLQKLLVFRYYWLFVVFFNNMYAKNYHEIVPIFQKFRHDHEKERLARGWALSIEYYLRLLLLYAKFLRESSERRFRPIDNIDRWFSASNDVDGCDEMKATFFWSGWQHQSTLSAQAR